MICLIVPRYAHEVLVALYLSRLFILLTHFASNQVLKFEKTYQLNDQILLMFQLYIGKVVVRFLQSLFLLVNKIEKIVQKLIKISFLIFIIIYCKFTI